MEILGHELYAKKDKLALQNILDPIVLSTMEAEHLPGVAVVIVQNGETVFKQGYGYSNLDTEQKVDPDTTLFRIGSVSKALTALAITRLDDQGVISLEDSVAIYFEGFDEIPNIGGGESEVTIRHLITHTAGLDQIGIGRHVWNLDLPIDERKMLRPSITAFLNNGNLRRTSPPGEFYRYDTYGLTLAGAVLSDAMALSYAEAMKSSLFLPAVMTRTFVEVKNTMS